MEEFILNAQHIALVLAKTRTRSALASAGPDVDAQVKDLFGTEENAFCDRIVLQL